MLNPSPEQRRASRLRTLIPATISFNNGLSTLGCVIRNMSDTGAKLAVSGGIALPDRFDLTVPQKNVAHRVRVAWRRGDEVGVTFETAAASEGAPDSVTALRQRIKTLEAEITRLQSRILQLTEG